MHPSIEEKLRYFSYGHLPLELQEISKPFCELAQLVAEQCVGSQATLALQKLLEAKDCAVRAKLE
jgi:hypothetical protein